eukprot:12980033-Heterocapsa_arctica.AAC.1
MLEVETQSNRLEKTVEQLPQEEPKEDMDVMVLHTEIPQARTCAEMKVEGGEIPQEELKRDCRNRNCLTCAGRDPNSGYNQKEFPIQG